MLAYGYDVRGTQVYLLYYLLVLQCVFVRACVCHALILHHTATNTVVVCCSVLQYGAVCCSVLQCVFVCACVCHAFILQHTATNTVAVCCSVWQCVFVRACVCHARRYRRETRADAVTHCNTLGKTGVTADRDKIELRLFNSSSIFNITLREELLSSPKQIQSWLLVLVSWLLVLAPRSG